MNRSKAAKVIQRAAVERMKWAAGLRYRNQVSRFREFSEQEFWDYQHATLRLVYADAVRYVPYYRDHPVEYPRHLDESPDAWSTLRQLPILSKDVVKSETMQFWRNPPLFYTRQHSTGGSSTGTPMPVRASLAERGWTNAILEDRFLHLVGTRTPRVVRVSGFVSSGEDLFWKIPGTGIAYLSAYGMTTKNLKKIEAFFERFRPQVVHGYPSAIHQLALLVEQSGRRLNTSDFIVITTAETLLPVYREDIERVFGSKVYDEYGSQEGQHFAIQCTAGTMHVHPGRGIVEVLEYDDDRPVKDGETGRVVVTGLANRSMPLFRYDIGDRAVSSGFSPNCACGLRWPSIGTVQGRVEEMIHTRDGRQMSMLANATMKGLNEVRKWQVVQYGYEDFLYRIVLQNSGSDVANIERHICSELSGRIGMDVNVKFEYLGDIPLSRSGKFRPVIVDIRNWQT